MACLLVSNSLSLSLTQSLPSTFSARASFTPSPSPSPSTAVRFAGNSFRRNLRFSTVVTRAGPSTSSYLFAFALPFSLLVITIFSAWRIGEKLDREFLEEMAMNEAIMAANEDDDEDGDEDDTETFVQQEEPAVTPARNRPKREA